MLPQLIYLALLFIGLGITFARHGKPKEGNHNAWHHLIAVILGLLILWWGGFFNGWL